MVDDPDLALDYPARYLFSFLQHHGMLGVYGSPQWRTVTGGSREYVRRVGAGLPDVRLGTKVTSVLETADGVEITDGNGEVSTYDAVVIATHPDQALAMLAEPTTLQRDVLAAMPYSPNTAQLHTDTSVLPSEPSTPGRPGTSSARATTAGQVTVTYDLTRLQRLDTDTHYLVTLGGTDLVDPAKVIETMEYAHPIYTPESVAAQRRLPEIETSRLAFAGAYHGWGFHEDGARSGLAAAERLGFELARRPTGRAASRPARAGRLRDHHPAPAPPAVPARVHLRLATAGWSTSTRCPRRAVRRRSRPATTSASPDRTIRENVDAFLATRGIDLDGGRVLMLANPRALGYSFNPISVFWCHDRAGALAGTILEVHNTYGDRHAYLVHTDEHGKAEVDKAMYVSPFHDVSGRYEISAPVPGDTVAVSITLRHTSGPAFTASMTGYSVAGRPPLRAALSALVGSARIRIQGIGLWLRRLPVRPRPHHTRQEGVQ